jgi:phosphatidylglycerol:prolipoprotein diacylglycerol transferase
MINTIHIWGPINIHIYGLMIAIGAIAAYLTVEFRAKKKGMQYELVFGLFWWCLIGGILGAKVLYLLTQIKAILADPSNLLNVAEGFVVYGGIIGGILSGALFCITHKLKFLEYFDLVMPSIALAQGFGRIGCIFAGCCYGEETGSNIFIKYNTSDYAPLDVHLIPTQPISSALNFLNFAVLIFLSRKVKTSGQIAGFYLIFYSAGRFIIEFFRGDLERGTIGVLSTSQFIAVFLFILGCGIVIVREIQYRKAIGKSSEEPTEEKE